MNGLTQCSEELRGMVDGSANHDTINFFQNRFEFSMFVKSAIDDECAIRIFLLESIDKFIVKRRHFSIFFRGEAF